ncbi:uncharacterized protein KGF55_001023 [Candida pseudojiufengensis]|uniref:uncharacterized protein n=1 Tax=Candida pseudojiufengensis TaxID=497109 RepID=UPI0022251DDC|nr:uncharacterized protein KGF55_001023 [Candida pseudojiufengensis]KAI5965661.1 hypothetical protein KGF55_001023 [Candida pseudojiufengensis]
MRKYQLIGRKGGRSFTKKKQIQYDLLHLHSLPLEILLRIFNNLQEDFNSLLSLALTCHKFYILICKNLLYKSIEFKTPGKFLKFSNQHLNQEVSNKINYIETINFINPQIPKSSKHKITIAGSYAVESNDQTVNTLSYSGFISSLKSLFTQAYGLRCLEFSEIAPEFAFPIDSKSSGSIWRRKVFSAKRTLPKLVLKSQSGWSIPLRNIHLSLICEYFDEIKELHLVNFIIDQPIDLNIKIDYVLFESCSYSTKKSKVPCTIFKDTTSLKLKNVTNVAQLSLIDLVKMNNKLNKLTLNLKSPVFYTNGEFNFTKYNPFFKLLGSQEGGYSTITTLVLKEFDLFDYLQHDDVHSQDVDSWVEPPTNNFETFITYISHIPNLTLILKKTPIKVKTCVKCGFKEQDLDKKIESLTNEEWEIFLKPLEFQKDNNLKILNHDLNCLYSVSKST